MHLTAVSKVRAATDGGDMESRGGDSESRGGDTESHVGDVEYWKKRGKEAFMSKFRHPGVIGTIYELVEKIPKKRWTNHMMNPEEFEYYTKKCKESKGFDVRGCTGSVCGGVVGIKKNKNNRYMKAAELLARFAVDQQNQKEETMLEYIELVDANVQGVAGILYYLTLRAIDKRDGLTKIFWAKVYNDMNKKDNLVSFEEAPSRYYAEMEELLQKSKLPKRKKVKPKWKKVGTRSRSRGQQPFVAFVKNLRCMPILDKLSYSEVVSISSSIWALLSCEEKAEFRATGATPGISMVEEKVVKMVEEHYIRAFRNDSL